MRIAFATTEFLTEKTFDGGLANYIYRVSEALINLGHEPVVFVASDTNNELFYKKIKVIKVLQTKYTWWFWMINCFTLFQINPALLLVLKSYHIRKAIEKFNKRNKIDIVQYTNSQSLGILLPKKIPSLVRISSYQKFIDDAYGYKHTFRLRQKQYLQDLMLYRAENIFGPSEKIGDFISKKFNKKVKIIESPFLPISVPYDNSALEIIKSKTTGGEYLLYFGSLTVLKGVTDIAEILEKLFSKYTSLYFVFVGKTIDVNKKPIIEILNEKAGIHKNKVIWIGSSTHNLLYPIIKNAKLVILPSRIDNFPNTCIEAMSLGKIVVGTKNTSFEQLIDDEKSGYLSEPANPENLLNTIENAMKTDDEKLKRISDNACKRIEILKPEIVVKQLVEYYNKIILS